MTKRVRNETIYADIKQLLSADPIFIWLLQGKITHQTKNMKNQRKLVLLCR